jgi:hypothetical protein
MGENDRLTDPQLDEVAMGGAAWVGELTLASLIAEVREARSVAAILRAALPDAPADASVEELARLVVAERALYRKALLAIAGKTPPNPWRVTAFEAIEEGERMRGIR